jgi:hypothetical protein
MTNDTMREQMLTEKVRENLGFAMHSKDRRSPSSPFPGGSAESAFL